MTRTAPPRILVAVDFGEASASALWVAAGLAARAGGRVSVLHAETLEAPPYFTPGQLDALERDRRAARAGAEAFTREFAAAHGLAGAEAIVVDGPPADAILERAAAADLLVLGTHGYRGARRWWLGSVAERVVRAATVPVLVVHAVEPRAGTWAPERLMVLGAPARTAEEAWVGLTGQPWTGPIEAAATADACPRERLTAGTLIVQPLPPPVGGDELPPGTGRLLTGCPAPVLFLPGPGSRTERR
jgi:nucleotide-binding universal stress UspA family protein